MLEWKTIDSKVLLAQLDMVSLRRVEYISVRARGAVMVLLTLIAGMLLWYYERSDTQSNDRAACADYLYIKNHYAAHSGRLREHPQC